MSYQRIKKALKIVAISAIGVFFIGLVGLFVSIFFLLKGNGDSISANLSVIPRVMPKGQSDLMAQPGTIASPQDLVAVAHENLPDRKEPKGKLKLNELFSRLAQIDNIESDSKQSAGPHLCDILCDDSQLDKQQESFISFYEKEGRRAFDDPEFRLKLKSMHLISQLFTPSTYRMMRKLEEINFDELSTAERMQLAVRLEFQILPEFYSFARRAGTLQEKNKNLRSIKNLRKQCAQRSRDDLKAECVSVDFENEG